LSNLRIKPRSERQLADFRAGAEPAFDLCQSAAPKMQDLQGFPVVDYLAVKAAHMTCAAVSYALFFARGVWMMRESPMLGRRWVKVLPHVNDSILLAAAIFLALRMQQYPFVDGWLTAKVLALGGYIVLGMVALHPGRPKPLRVGAWIGAQLVFFYIVAVAITKNPFVLA
jgi:uncharacterized membrane protein SirB2